MRQRRYKLKLYIDDIRVPATEGWDIVRTSSEAVEYLKLNGCPRFISFDHDLGGDDTAMIVVHWMVDKDLDDNGNFIPKDFDFNVHSANPVGVKNIVGLLGQYLRVKNEDFAHK